MPNKYRIGSHEVTFAATAPADIAGTTATRWHVTDRAGRHVVSGLDSEDVARAAMADRIRGEELMRVALAGGATVLVRRHSVDRFRGLDADGFQVFADGDGDGWLYAVTGCCQATGKGSGGGVVCRSCHLPVDPYFGGSAEVATGRDDTVPPVEASTTLVRLPHTGIRVPHTRFAVKSLKQMETSDGVAYTGVLWLDRHKIGTVENRGDGGPTVWYPTARDRFTRADMSRFAADSLDEHGEPIFEDHLLACLVDESDAARTVARLERDGRLAFRTLYAVGDGDGGVAYTYPDGYFAAGARIFWPDKREAITHNVWHDWRAAHAIEVWYEGRWESLPKPAFRPGAAALAEALRCGAAR